MSQLMAVTTKLPINTLLFRQVDRSIFWTVGKFYLLLQKTFRVASCAECFLFTHPYLPSTSPTLLPAPGGGWVRTTSTLVDPCPLAYSWVQLMGDTGKRVAQEGRGWGINILSSLSFSFSFYSCRQWIG